MQPSPEYDYLDHLNPQQRDAVVYNDGPALVIAGAGSGKTRVLTYKIVHLLRLGYEPWRILALTFTNKAAREMRQRITAIVGEKVASRLWMGTFHSIFLRILRIHADLVGFKPGFTIYDSADTRSLLKQIIRELELDEKVYKPATVASAISNAKNALILPDQYLADRDTADRDKRARRPLTGQIYKEYCDRCRRSNAMDFDDILVFMNLLLRDHPEVARRYGDQFRYILVDEYQDTNFSQHLIVSQLVAVHNRLCAVGDDAQSIYSFRGADIGHILNLQRRYPDLRIFKLERNYRSTQNIINAAGSLIDKNTRQMKKNVYSENEPGSAVEVIRTYSDMEEAFTVAGLISGSQLSCHDSLDEYAVLYRTNAQSRVIEEALRKRAVPYRIYGGLSFYQRKEVKDMIAYFRLAVNPDDDEAFRRVVNYPARGIGDTTMRRLSELAASRGVSLWQALAGDLRAAGMNSAAASRLLSFRALVSEFVADNESGSDAYALGRLIYNRTGILTLLAHDSTPEGISRQENLSEILSGLKEFVDVREQTGEGESDMRAFLSEVMLLTDQDQTEDDGQSKVTLMTVHAAKGLEFNHVYVVGVEEDLFPSAMSQDSLAQVEEERRLLYVAMTRARNTCTLTYAQSRFRNGQTVMTNPSRFLSDIDSRFLDLHLSGGGAPGYAKVNPVSNYRQRQGGPTGVAGMKKVSSLSQQLSGVQAQHGVSEVPVGTRIRHERFGTGTVKAIGNLSGEDMITVDFGVVGIKKLLLKFAKFDIL